MRFGGALAIGVLAHVVKARAAASGSVVRVTAAQERSLDIHTAKIKAVSIRPVMTLYGELQRNPDAVWTLSSQLAGVVKSMPGKKWPQIGAKVIRGTSLAGIKPVVSTTLQITLGLELTKVKADLAAAKVAELTSTAAYAREKTLYAHNKAVSLQRVQAAQAAFAGARARVRADAQSIAAIVKQLKNKAGGFLPLPIFQSGVITDISAHPGEAVAADQPLLKIEDFHTLVAAVALPASDTGRIAMGAAVRVRVLGHKRWLRARPLTLGPKADPQTRGLSMLYLIHHAGTLRPGMAITALAPKAGKNIGLTFIPRTAVVWWRGERWIYLQRARGVFVLHRLVHPITTPGGFGVKEGTVPPERVVTGGAQFLMSIQLRATLKPVE